MRALAHPLVWAGISSLYFLAMMALYGYTFWAPIIVRDTLRVSPVATGFITGRFACLAVVAMLAVGASSDRTGDRCLHMAGALGMTALGYVMAALLPTPLGRVAGLALVITGVESFLAPFWCLPSVLLRGSAAAAAIALVNSVGNLGSFAGSYVVGWLADATGGTTVGFLLLAAVALAAALLSVVLRRQAAFAPARRADAGGLPRDTAADTVGVVGGRL